MTLAMPDSIRSLDLPAGYPAYLGYVDGHWPTIHGYTDDNGVHQPPLAKLFPAAHLIGLTVSGSTMNADGIDCEPGNPDAADAAGWVSRKLNVSPAGFRPAVYASTIGTPGYGMVDVLPHLAALGIPRELVRLLTAHYEWKSGTGADTMNRHICGPGSCGLLPVNADGTQWTDVWPGAAQVVDLSACRDDFFGPAPFPQPPPPATWTADIMNELPILTLGDTGTHVRTCQFQLREKGRNEVIIDGVFGPVTEGAVRAVQASRHLDVDGAVGPQTWPVLLGVA